ncbi:MAG: Membrane-bound lytic murein transglycosylase C [Myxococcota bacterium]|nr:Membrane-bound lytic murein transglycosylase C [Myxococcota bacterium]
MTCSFHRMLWAPVLWCLAMPAAAQDDFFKRKEKESRGFFDQKKEESERFFKEREEFSKAWFAQKERISREWFNQRQRETELWRKYTSDVRSVFGRYEDAPPRTWQEYMPSLGTRTLFDFDKKEFQIEILVPKDSKDGSKVAVERAGQHLRGLYGDNVRDMNDLLRYDDGRPVDRSNLEDYIQKELGGRIKPTGREVRGKDGKVMIVYGASAGMVQDLHIRRAKKYIPLVERWAAEYGLPKQFVLGIMWQESRFNPDARSHVGALGLMQLMPQYAAHECFRWLTKDDKAPMPPNTFILDPQNNVMLGVTYLHLLMSKYFGQAVADPTKRTYFSIAAYNWGPRKFLFNLIKQNDIAALPNETVFRMIRENPRVPNETRDYLHYVTGAMSDWDRIMRENRL